MAHMNLEFYRLEDGYSDGEIEKTMLRMAETEDDLSAAAESSQSFPILCHFSHLRENILNWYPFEQEATILEVGAGCGALTGLLCERLSSVTAVELTKQRADILFARHGSRENLEIMVGNFCNMIFPQKFDYVLLNGVLEYAISFVEDDRPFEAFLSFVRETLAPNGKVLIAIENRLGLKYLNGGREDHLGTFFSGINGYNKKDYVRTFSKEELNDLLRKSGYKNWRYYYPYPDYKFPNEIFSDESITKMGYGKKYSVFDASRAVLFDETHMNESLAKEEIAGYFANSFLVEASQQVISESQVYYVKLSNDRAAEYRIYTLIPSPLSDGRVEKVVLDNRAKAHLEHIIQAAVLSTKGLEYLEGTPSADNKITYPYLHSETVEQKLLSLIIGGNIDGFYLEIDRFLEAVSVNTFENDSYDTGRFIEWFGDAHIPGRVLCVSPANIDMVFDNILLNSSQYIVLDSEWWCDFPVPILYILWRALWNFFAAHPNDLKDLPFQKLLDRYEISPAMVECFIRWTEHFSKNYVGFGQLAGHAKTEYPICLEAAIEHQMLASQFSSRLYLGEVNENGLTFTEENVIEECVPIDEAGGFHVCFTMAEESVSFSALRWDPVENLLVVCEITDVQGDDGRKLHFEAVPPCQSVENKTIFFDTDPKYVIQGDLKGLQEIHISGSIDLSIEQWLPLAYDELRRVYSEEKEKIQLELLASQNKQLELGAEIASKQSLIEGLQVELGQKEGDLNAEITLHEQTMSRHRALQANFGQIENQRNDLVVQIEEMENKPIRSGLFLLRKKIMTMGRRGSSS